MQELNFLLSILVHKEVLNKDEAELLASHLVGKIYSQDFTEAHRVVEAVWKKEIEPALKSL